MFVADVYGPTHDTRCLMLGTCVVQWARQDAERQQHERERECQATRLQAERAILRYFPSF